MSDSDNTGVEDVGVVTSPAPVKGEAADPSWWPTERHPLLEGEFPICGYRLLHPDHGDSEVNGALHVGCCSEDSVVAHILRNPVSGQVAYACTKHALPLAVLMDVEAGTNRVTERAHFMATPGHACRCIDMRNPWSLKRAALVQSRKDKKFCIRCEREVLPSSKTCTSSQWFRLPKPRRI